MTYTTIVKVRFGDIDHAGVAYYPNLYHYLHIAFEEFFEEFAGTPYPEVLEKEKVGFPTVKVETRFIKPIRYGDTLAVTLAIPRVGRSSAELVFTAIRRGDGACCMESRQTVVAVDMNSFLPIPIPARFRKVFGRCGATA